jgi:hypothetical protein
VREEDAFTPLNPKLAPVCVLNTPKPAVLSFCAVVPSDEVAESMHPEALAKHPASMRKPFVAVLVALPVSPILDAAIPRKEEDAVVEVAVK